jgi:hypothetical protein
MALVHVTVEELQFFIIYLFFVFFFNCFFEGTEKRLLFFTVVTGSASAGPFPCTKADGVSSLTNLIDCDRLDYEALYHALKREVECLSETL